MDKSRPKTSNLMRDSCSFSARQISGRGVPPKGSADSGATNGK
jgi:hypothetical protein